ncbi:MAG: 1-(5-phosphoribosyl)-5-[(5-phosphoribosylamino)methylideneamino]imidazole-4-carboxamide isomerase [Euryarchaeota archaeon]|nr:1-(5-phosphoribosyl)-5-[(5-phosphoribosylamino)methylideneamino]imidazole-4-carboxamide isomerase [Euryarchaeota archaeon]
MDIYPAVDILDGKCVQLVQGRRENRREYGSPVAQAERWLEMGAEALHIINLDGAFGQSRKNAEIIREIVSETDVTIQLGGGIRSTDDAAGWLKTGVERVILGTLAIQKPESIEIISGEFGSEAVMTGVDAKDGQVVIRGWEEPAGDYITWAQKFETLGAGSLLYTNVDVEGLEEGINPLPVKHLVNSTGLPVVAAGGISSVSDIITLKAMGVSGVVLGSALYSGKIDFMEALEAAEI